MVGVGHPLAVEFGDDADPLGDGAADCIFDDTGHDWSPSRSLWRQHTSYGNSVNMKYSTSEKTSYHHGDLRAALIDAGLTDARGARGRRSVACAKWRASVGVSATAVYRHFPDKAALRGALAQAA